MLHTAARKVPDWEKAAIIFNLSMFKRSQEGNTLKRRPVQDTASSIEQGDLEFLRLYSPGQSTDSAPPFPSEFDFDKFGLMVRKKYAVSALSNATESEGPVTHVQSVMETNPESHLASAPEETKPADERLSGLTGQHYSVERLYMKLSARTGTNWNGRGLSLEEENSNTALRLQLWLSMWANRLDDDSMNSMGLSKSPTTRTITPTYTLRETGFDGGGNSNRLLYLEMVHGGGTRPTDPRLIWPGNFATQDGGSGHPPIRAYLLNHEIFFDKFILPELCALNKASNVWYERLEFGAEPDGTNIDNDTIKTDSPSRDARAAAASSKVVWSYRESVRRIDLSGNDHADMLQLASAGGGELTWDMARSVLESWRTLCGWLLRIFSQPNALEWTM
ncbi:hypothetical protein B0I35DRAFT_485101 [Stachybotrys elegans]|uniref:Uncharacterized protein n=1 Tax=Stachybotrys elegans TaxID=80388 RepID=A0A8K0SBU5_9HYPO|nr:hypothetical protein B0I35DRAFT_485101 [Stachybotrys elegans]